MDTIKVTQEVYDKIQEHLESNTSNSNLDFIQHVMGAFNTPKETK